MKVDIRTCHEKIIRKASDSPAKKKNFKRKNFEKERDPNQILDKLCRNTQQEEEGKNRKYSK